jgi:UDP-N-acetylglucosamine 2-epimerase (non-hydrolysing)
MKPVIVVVGARPQIVKMVPVIKLLKSNSVPFVFVHCGQHYDYSMSHQFIEELELPLPDYDFKVKAASTGVQTARIKADMYGLLREVAPSHSSQLHSASPQES